MSVISVFLILCRPYLFYSSVYVFVLFYGPCCLIQINDRTSGFHSKAAGGGLGWGKTAEGLGDDVPQKRKNFESSYKQILCILVVVFFPCMQASFH